MDDLRLSENAVVTGTYPKLDYGLLLPGNRSSESSPTTYILVISLNPIAKEADKASMVTTIIVHQGIYQFIYLHTATYSTQ